MNKELLAFSVAGLHLPADNGEGLVGPFRTVSALMRALEEPELDLLKEKYFVLRAKAEKIKAIEKATVEYGKYQVHTLSPVEEEYLEIIKNIHSTAKKKAKK